MLLQLRRQGRAPPIDRALDAGELIELGLHETAREIGLTHDDGTAACRGLQLDDAVEVIADFRVDEAVALEFEQEVLPAPGRFLPSRLRLRPAPVTVDPGPRPDCPAQLAIRDLRRGVSAAHSPYFMREYAVGARKLLVMLAMIGPSRSLSARFACHSGSFWNALHLRS